MDRDTRKALLTWCKNGGSEIGELEMRITILGSGTSHGVPMIGCDCAVCRSSNPRDRRTRTSALIETAGKHLLIDTSPELRLQCLACNVRQVDAVLYTHGHADHVAGLDDLRRFNALQSSSLTCYADENTAKILRRMFSYAFMHILDYPSSKPHLEIELIQGPFEVQGVAVQPIALLHGELPILGYRIGSFAYCTDCSDIPNASMELLRDLDVLVLDALRHRPHPTHMNLQQSIAMAQRIGARRTYFTHIAHELLHDEVNASLPDSMQLGYDGLIIEL